MEEVLFLFVLFVAFAGGFRFVADGMDRSRIRGDVARRGGEVLDITWSPFGKGWFGERGDRIYRVRWADADGRPHASWVKTSLLSGVYWTEEGPRPAGPEAGGDVERLRRENAELRAELDRLRGGPR